MNKYWEKKSSFPKENVSTSLTYYMYNVHVFTSTLWSICSKNPQKV